MGPTWGPPGADRTQVSPMLGTWTLLALVQWNTPERSACNRHLQFVPGLPCVPLDKVNDISRVPYATVRQQEQLQNIRLFYPAGARRNNNVIITSKRRCDVFWRNNDIFLHRVPAGTVVRAVQARVQITVSYPSKTVEIPTVTWPHKAL